MIICKVCGGSVSPNRRNFPHVCDNCEAEVVELAIDIVIEQNKEVFKILAKL